MPKIVTEHQGHMLFATEIGEHVVETDVPLSMGGADRAPTSLQVFASSIPACVATFVAGYCQQSGISIEGMRVELDFEMAQDPLRMTDLRLRVVLPEGDVGPRAAAVRRAAEQCPVHNTMRHLGEIGLEIVDRVAVTA